MVAVQVELGEIRETVEHARGDSSHPIILQINHRNQLQINITIEILLKVNDVMITKIQFQ